MLTHLPGLRVNWLTAMPSSRKVVSRLPSVKLRECERSGNTCELSCTQRASNSRMAGSSTLRRSGSVRAATCSSWKTMNGFELSWRQ